MPPKVQAPKVRARSRPARKPSSDAPRSGEVVEAASRPLDALQLSPGVTSALKNIHAEFGEVYRERFIEMTEALAQQASALKRIQETLHILVDALRPQLASSLDGQTVPIAMRIAQDGEAPDIASAVVVSVADPIGMGYTFSLVDVTKALQVPNPLSSAGDVGILMKALKIQDDGDCAVTVRQGGPRNKIVNYHPRAIARFRALLAAPPPEALTDIEKSALSRLKRKLADVPQPSG
jgi:hypothetical protein